MSNTVAHKKISDLAYGLLLTKIDGFYFPNWESVRLYSGLLSPDSIHIFKHVALYSRYNHMNSVECSGVLDRALKYYGRLVKSLRGGFKYKSAMNASWLAHFVADALEPVHMSTWRFSYFNISFSRLSRHLWIEKHTNSLVSAPVNVDDISTEFNPLQYLKSKGLEIGDFGIFDLYPDRKWEIPDLYAEKVIPLQVRAVVVFWYNAIVEANEYS